MRAEEELSLIAPERDTALTIGVFDGVHLGHRRLIEEVKRQAESFGLLSSVITFHPHPRTVLSPRTKLNYVTSLEERLALIRQLGIDIVVPLTFDMELAQLGARDFVSLLKRYLRMRALVVGPDFALGHKREGNINKLESLGQEMGFSVHVVQPQVIDGTVVSSTTIRNALAKGDVDWVTRLLGRRLSLSGTVISGAERGRTLGFPTANIVMEPNRALPADGVYAAIAYTHDSKYPAVINIGRRPTFDNGERIIEVHLLDFKGNLYGKPLRVDLIQRIRGEIRFDSVDRLKAQIANDIELARKVLQEQVSFIS